MYCTLLQFLLWGLLKEEGTRAAQLVQCSSCSARELLLLQQRPKQELKEQENRLKWEVVAFESGAAGVAAFCPVVQ